MIIEDFVSFETAKLLKEKRFGGGCFSMYVTPKPHSGMGNPNEAKIAPHGRDSYYYEGYEYQCEAPTLQMAIKWLREVHSLYLDIATSFSQDGICYTFSCSNTMDLIQGTKGTSYHEYQTYEEACEAGIRYTLENLI